MFNKETYIRRRSELKRLVGEGVVILFGNNEAPYNYPANAYAPMRQDSSFLYFFGQHRDGLVGVIDIDNDEEWLFGDDIDVEDIVWMGFTPSVADLAAEVGITKTAPMAELEKIVNRTREALGSSKKSVNRKYEDRPIDIDILLYDNLTIDEPDLKIPHPLMHQRDFVMIPLNEIKTN